MLRLQDLRPDQKIVKDFSVVLKDMKPMVENPKYLRNGREIPNFTLLPREAWGNWLLCVVLRHIHGEAVTFAEDKAGDGILIDKVSEVCFPIEHVSVLDVPSKKPKLAGDQLIINAVLNKASRGEEYARGKMLLVFFEGVGMFTRQKIRENIRYKHAFRKVYSVGFVTSDHRGYCYIVTEYNNDHSLSFTVTIAPDFNSWRIDQVMD